MTQRHFFLGLLCSALLSSTAILLVCADQLDHNYADGDGVILWANKVGPYHKSVHSSYKLDATSKPLTANFNVTHSTRAIVSGSCELLFDFAYCCAPISPSETYPYYSIPGCPQLQNRPLEVQEDSLGILLEGDTLVDTGVSFPFKRNQEFVKVCDMKLGDAEIISQLEFIVQNHYWYHLLVDELPLFGMVGEYITEDDMKAELETLIKEGAATNAAAPIPKAQGFIYTHRDFSISYNGRHIIEVNLTSENPRPLALGQSYPMTYSVTWVSTEQPFESRFNRYLDYDFFEHQIHTFSILNSFMVVIFLCGLVLLILSRTIKAGIANMGALDTELATSSFKSSPTNSPGGQSPSSPGGAFDGLGEETGWKLLVGDVFRAPSHLLLYSILLGTGIQLFLLIFAILLLGILAVYFYEERQVLLGCLLLIYSLTSLVQGYVSAWYYKVHGGLFWKKSLFAAAAFFPACLLFIITSLNIVATTYGSHGILSLSSSAFLVVAWMFVSLPLSIAGNWWARNHTQVGQGFPCRVNAIKRLIPSEASSVGASFGSPSSASGVAANSSVGQWYTNYYVLVLMSGVLPFGSIFIELYSILTSFWNYKYTYIYSMLFMVLCIYFIVSSCVAIVSTYILLNAEDYRWHWMSFLASASSCFYIFGYAVYFFHFKTSMEGVVQTVFYFAQVTIGVGILALMTGSVGAMATRIFITKIYSYTKAD